MDVIPSNYAPGMKYLIDGADLSALARARNEWANIEVRDVDSSNTDTAAVSKLVRAEGKTILQIARPPGGGGGSLPANVSYEMFTICNSGSAQNVWLATWFSDPTP